MRNVKKGSFTGRLRFSRVIGFMVGELIGHCVKVSSKNEHGEESESFAFWGTVRFYEPPMFLFPETYREGSGRGWDGRILECAEVCRNRSEQSCGVPKIQLNSHYSVSRLSGIRFVAQVVFQAA